MDGINVINMLINMKEIRKELPKWIGFADSVLLTNDFIILHLKMGGGGSFSKKVATKPCRQQISKP